MSTSIVMGPVLSFRGLTPVSKKQSLWKVTALIIVGRGEAPPALAFLADGKAVPAPVLLAQTGAGDAYRYDLSVPLGDAERRVVYGIAGERADVCWPAQSGPGTRPLSWSFTVPAWGQSPRMAYFSCNGFSDPKLIKALKVPANAVWQDLLCNHDKAFRPAGYALDREQQWHEGISHDLDVQRFHLVLAGGDQVYMDSIWTALPELNAWVELDEDEQLSFQPSPALVQEIEAYYWEQYALRWSMVPGDRQRDQADAYLNAGLAFATMPTVMMWDDHDIFDGWGSYSAGKQKCPLLQAMFKAARQAFWVYQLQMPLKLLPTLLDQAPAQAKDPLFQPVDWAAIRQKDAMSLPFLDGQAACNHVLPLGDVALCVMDLRTERSQQQILSLRTWAVWQDEWASLSGAKHVLVMSSVPVAHPKLSLIEGAVTWLASDNTTSGDADDLNDHWSHDRHEDERKRLVRTLVQLGERMKARVTLVSGDVHVAAWGYAERNVLASNGQRVNQFTSTAIVHPSLSGFVQGLFLKYMNAAAAKPQVLDAEHTIHMMTFPGGADPIMPARNWLALELDAQPKPEFEMQPRLWATWRTEQEDGFRNHLAAVHPYKAVASGGSVDAQAAQPAAQKPGKGRKKP